MAALAASALAAPLPQAAGVVGEVESVAGTAVADVSSFGERLGDIIAGGMLAKEKRVPQDGAVDEVVDDVTTTVSKTVGGNSPLGEELGNIIAGGMLAKE